MPVAVAKPKAAVAFPTAEVKSCLRDELLEAAETEAALHGTPWPAGAAARSAVSIRIDSLVVVEILCAVEPLLGFELSDELVLAGGYRSVEAAVGHLIPRIEREWQKRNGGKS